MHLKTYVLATSLLVVLLTLRCLWLWQPERQLLKHHENFLKAAANRDAEKMAEFLSPDYSDRWGHDKAFLARESREILRHFFTLEITGDQTWIRLPEETPERGSVSSILRMNGTGTAIAQMAQAEVNGLTEPFVFQWVKAGWKPWDWKLMSIDHSQLHLGNRSSLY